MHSLDEVIEVPVAEDDETENERIRLERRKVKARARCRSYAKGVYDADPVSNIAKARAWQAANPEKVRQSYNRWAIANPDKAARKSARSSGLTKARRERQKAAGLCVDCHSPAVRGTRCEEHANAEASAARARYAKKKAAAGK